MILRAVQFPAVCPYDSAPGCDNEACCQSVCQFDIFCCVAEWDQLCTQLASALCTH